jgi:hypothetical protein
MTNTFKGERKPTSADPAVQALRDYMLEYMREYRRRQRANLPTARKPVTVAAVKVRRHDHPGFCGLCGHASPVATCPVCVVEMGGAHVVETSPAWKVMLSASN